MNLKFGQHFLALGAVASLIGSGPASAAFEARSLDANPTDVEGWYDTVSGLTWLQDLSANATAAGLYPGSVNTSSYTAAATWAAGLVYGESSDWQIPTLAQSQNLQTAGFLIPTYFEGMGTNSGALWIQGFMWTSTPLTPGVSQYVLRISGVPLGLVDAAIYDRGFQVFAVAAGDLGQPLSPIPEPSAYALMCLGLLGVAFARRRAA